MSRDCRMVVVGDHDCFHCSLDKQHCKHGRQWIYQYLPSEDRRWVQNKSEGQEVSKCVKSSCTWQGEKWFFFLPKIFIWSPWEQFPEVKLLCSVHKCHLEPKTFTSEFEKQDKMPRIIFDLFGNILLIQCIYLCNTRGHRHNLVASSNNILSSLPDHICNIFLIPLFPCSGCTKIKLH